MTATIPSVEITHNADSLGIRRPDRKSRSRDMMNLAGVGSEDTVGLVVLPLPEQVQVDFAQQRRKGVRITLTCARSISIGDLDRVGIRSGRKRRRDVGLKESVRMDLRERDTFPSLERYRHGDGSGMKDPQRCPTGSIRPHTQKVVRITVPALQQRVEILRRKER